MNNQSLDVMQFEKEWVNLAKKICFAIYHNEGIKKIRENLKKNGFLTLEEKSSFIDICDAVKYEFIYKKYGSDGSEGYEKFNKAWKDWFKAKGVSSQQNRGQRNSVDHILFVSTPDPEEFLASFEKECAIESEEKN